MIYYHKFCEFNNESGKTCLPLGKTEFWTHWEFAHEAEFLALGKALNIYIDYIDYFKFYPCR